jgi:hypothetical protein
MDVNVNTTSYLPEISGNYITSIFDKFKVSFILLLIVVVVVYIMGHLLRQIVLYSC